MKVLIYIAIGALVLGFLAWRAHAAQSRSQAAHAAVAAGAKLLDVRTPQEFAAGHLPGAINIPVDQLAARVKELGGAKEPVVVYCRSGNRSARAKDLLERQGHSVVDLGPMSAW